MVPGSVLPRSTRCTVIAPAARWNAHDLLELWQRRELLYFLVWRDLKVRYKQTVLGALWAVLQPVVTAVLFTVIFGMFARMPSDGLPYALFAYVGLLPWQLFAFALTESTNSVILHQQLLRKVYFPRLYLPLTPVVGALVDLGFASVVLVGMLVGYRVRLGPGLLLVPLLVVLGMVVALAASLWLAALNVKYRDVRYVVPFGVQVWFFATPVIYPSTLIPAQVRGLWAINPMASLVDALRWAVLGAAPPPLAAVAISSAVTAVLLVGGLLYFRHVEGSIADLV